MIDEKLQFAISQYVDGTLPADEAARLEARIASDGEARVVLEEYRRLDQMMRAARPAPEMDWDSFSRQISAAVEAGAESVPLAVGAQRPAWGWWRPVALAAGLLVCATAAIVAWKIQTVEPGQVELVQRPTAMPPGPRAESYAVVSVLRPNEMASTTEVQVEIGQASPDSNVWALAEQLTSTADSRMMIVAVPRARLADEEFGIVH